MAYAAVRIPIPKLLSDRRLIEQELREILPRVESSVSACMEYAVMGDGQRLRPILAMRAARLLGSPGRLTLRAAAAIEMLHCASLIVDDLPCMDNDDLRRNRPSAHVAYGEATALLAAFGLVALAARTVVEQDAGESQIAQRRFQIALLRTLDCASLIGGQLADLSGDRPALNDLKQTVPLFMLAIDAAEAYGPTPAPEELRRFGREYGIALQMTDDYLDGEATDYLALAFQLNSARDCLICFGVEARPLMELVDYLEARAQDHCHR